MAKDLDRNLNIYNRPCDHPELMETAKRFFVHDNSSFITDKDIANFAGWLIANIKDPEVIESFSKSFATYNDMVQMVHEPFKRIQYAIDKIEKDNGKEA